MSYRVATVLFAGWFGLVVTSVAMAQDESDSVEPQTLEQVCQQTPPACCGQICDPRARRDTCCPGTTCGQSGRCIPESCRDCGILGCRVDFETCTGTCGTPRCCLEECVRNVDCCPGTRCRPTGGGRSQCVPEACDECQWGCNIGSESCEVECRTPDCCHIACDTDRDCCAGTRCTGTSANRRCMPIECDRCTGLHPICRASADCEVDCLAPRSCGDVCTGDGDCGSGTYCRNFDSGNAHCVPRAFDEACRACGGPCGFDRANCEVVCPE